MSNKETFCLEVRSDFACFTRPEMKVERVSYDVITPSAARGVFEAILWKPAIKWEIKTIEVLNPIQWINLRRNEVGATASTRKKSIIIENERQQRGGLFLKNVAYRLHARFRIEQTESSKDTYPKFAEMFKRRARKGQCFNQPYLGTREFSAQFRFIESEDLKLEQPPIQLDHDLGWMLYDLDYSDPESPSPMFFNANLKNGKINCPAPDSAEVRR